jgi:aminoglycoside 6'-N-acetyltransferase
MNFEFIPLKRDDFPLLAVWLGKPHVQQWWHEPATVEHVSKEYGGCTRGDFATRVFVVAIGGNPVGMMQCYLADDYPEHAEGLNLPGWVGIDYLIGEVEFVGHGYGTAMIRDFCVKVVVKYYPQAPGIVADPEVRNLASVGALEKAGFVRGSIVPGEHGPEQLMILKLREATK